MRHILNILFLAVVAAPFVMPPNAVVSGENAEGGWWQSGEMALSYRQTRAQFGAKFAAAGWHHKHSVAIAKNRTVESWERGDETLTFMVWGQAPDKTGFSWGVSQASARPTPGRASRPATAAGRASRPATAAGKIPHPTGKAKVQR